MSGKSKPKDQGSSNEITIILVDDIPETRESIKKILAFEPDMKVVGTAGTGREGVRLAKELRPDIIIMDINMPDMDGLEATSIIKRDVPTSAVIIMSVQNDADYIRKAMRAGASDFLTKPINMDEVYNTIRQVYKDNEAERRRYEALKDAAQELPRGGDEDRTGGGRAGNIIAVYSPQGGAGTTTIATSLASGLMREGVKVLLVDSDLQFADVGIFLNLQAQSTIVDLAEDVEELDVDLFDNVVTTHDSGLKVLLGPARPEYAEVVSANPATVGLILEQIAGNYDFIVVDTNTAFNEVLLGVLDRTTQILLVTNPTLISLRHQRFVLELFDQLGYDPERVFLVVNRVRDDRKSKATISTEKIQAFLKRPVVGEIPLVDERILLQAINKGVPIIAADRNQNNPPIRQLLELAEAVYDRLTGEGEEEEVEEAEEDTRRRKGIFNR